MAYFPRRYINFSLYGAILCGTLYILLLSFSHTGDSYGGGGARNGRRMLFDIDEDVDINIFRQLKSVS